MALQAVAHETEIDAERSVLGGVLILGHTPPTVSLLRASDFASKIHALVFAAMLELSARGEAIDFITTARELAGINPPRDETWKSYLGDLTSEVPTAANVEYYAENVRKESRRRALLKIASEAVGKAQCAGADGNEVLGETVTKLSQLVNDGQVARASTMADLINQEFKAIEQRQKNGGVVGLPTGFADLDKILGGLHKGGVTVIAARPGMGKSALAANISASVAERGKNVLLFSLEMGREEQAQRFLAADSRVDLHRIRIGALRDSDWPKLANAMGRLYKSSIAIHDKGGLTSAELRSLARAYAVKNQVDLIVVDYLGLVHGERQRGDSREQEIAGISRDLKSLAMELNCPLIALSQLNRAVEGRADKRPMLSDLRDSGSIEQDAHQVLFIYRDDYYNQKSQDTGVAEICVAKNRNGPTGMIRLRWAAAFTKFEPMEVN